MKPWSWQALCRVFVVFGLLWGNAQAQEATIKRATERRQAPGDQSASLGALAADSSVSRTGERKGSWVKVRTPQGSAGWVHMFDLGAQPATASSNSTASGLRSVGGLFGGGSTTTATATVGIRGLSAEDLPRPKKCAWMPSRPVSLLARRRCVNARWSPCPSRHARRRAARRRHQTATL